MQIPSAQEEEGRKASLLGLGMGRCCQGMGWREEKGQERKTRGKDVIFSVLEPFPHSVPTKEFGVCPMDSLIR